MSDKGPIYGVELIDSLPLNRGGSGFRQAMPSAQDLASASENCDCVGCKRLVGGYEVLLQHWREAEAECEQQAKRIAELERERGSLQDVIRNAWCCVQDYYNDADNATHAKRHLRNALYDFDREWIEGAECRSDLNQRAKPMTDTATNAEVAEKVMGWYPPTNPGAVLLGSIPPCPKFSDYMNPPPEVEAWRSSFHWRKPDGKNGAPGSCWTRVPCFTTNPSDDYEVLKHVRECEVNGTPALNWEEFCNALYGMQAVRKRVSIGLITESAAWYEPGDFSRAALKALEER